MLQTCDNPGVLVTEAVPLSPTGATYCLKQSCFCLGPWRFTGAAGASSRRERTRPRGTTRQSYGGRAMNSVVSFGGNVDYEYLILGAGPAGLQMGHHLARAGHSYLILEGGDGPGSFFKQFPRHRTLISNNKVHTGSTDPEFNLRFDWNSLLDEDGRGELLF